METDFCFEVRLDFHKMREICVFCYIINNWFWTSNKICLKYVIENGNGFLLWSEFDFPKMGEMIFFYIKGEMDVLFINSK